MNKVAWIGLVLLGACSEEDLALMEVVAAEAPLEAVRERTRLERLGVGRLLPDGPPIDAEPKGWAPRGELAVVAVGERVQVVHEGGDATLLVWVEREDLGRWVVDGAWGSARPGAPGEAGVWFDGGVEVDVVDANGDWLAVEVGTFDLDVSAWVHGFEVGPYWVDEAVSPAADESEVVGWLRDGAEILDAPYGEQLAQVHDWGDEASAPGEGVAFLGVAVLDGVDGHTLVRVRQDGVRVTGWVDDRDVSDQVRGGRGGCGGSGFATGLGGWGVWPSLELPAETPLYAGPDGPLVGETVTARGWGVVEEGPGWVSIGVPSPWGRAVVTVQE